LIAGVCRVCGCTDSNACVFDPSGNLVDVADGTSTLPDGSWVCSWIEPDLCSGCVRAPAPPPLLVDLHGRPLRGAP
jgi:hypothetical protein